MEGIEQAKRVAETGKELALLPEGEMASLPKGYNVEGGRRIF